MPRDVVNIINIIKEVEMRVYIGVGHGGKDSGAVKYLVEKDINLKMALACRDYLKAAGVDTMISREDDREVSINEKVRQANEFNADIALDIHNNAGRGKGFEIYHTINGGTGKKLSVNIEKEVIAIGQNSRGLKTKKGVYGDYFGFIRLTKMPAIIPEGVFVDNLEDAALADTDEKCKMFGQAYAKGILATLTQMKNVDEENKRHVQAAVKTETCAYKVKVMSSELNIRKEAGTKHAVTGVIRDKGVYTIVAEKIVSEQKWGKLKSGAGWIYLAYTKKV